MLMGIAMLDTKQTVSSQQWAWQVYLGDLMDVAVRRVCLTLCVEYASAFMPSRHSRSLSNGFCNSVGLGLLGVV
jgi:hypothetical protein